jgi:hypothetical protein
LARPTDPKALPLGLRARITCLGSPARNKGVTSVAGAANLPPDISIDAALTLSADLHWIALASRQTREEAITFAQPFGKDVRVVKSEEWLVRRHSGTLPHERYRELSGGLPGYDSPAARLRVTNTNFGSELAPGFCVVRRR